MDNDALSAAAKPLVLPEFVTPPGEIDLTNAQSISDELHAAIGCGISAVIADMTRTTFLDSCGVRYLVHRSRPAAQDLP